MTDESLTVAESDLEATELPHALECVKYTRYIQIRDVAARYSVRFAASSTHTACILWGIIFQSILLNYLGD